MKPQKIKKILETLDEKELRRVLWFARYVRARHIIRAARPIDLLLPFAVVQMILFALIIKYSSNPLPALGIINFVFIGVIILFKQNHYVS